MTRACWVEIRPLVRFTLRCDDVLDLDDRLVAFVRVSTMAREDSPVIEGDVAHLIELRGDLLWRFTAYRDRDNAIAAAEAGA